MAKILYILTIICCFSLNNAAKCINQDPCTCKLDDYTWVDIGKIRPSEGNFFQDGLNGVLYFFSGCNNTDFNGKDYKGLFGFNKTITGVSLVKCISSIVPLNVTGYPAINETCTAIGDAKHIEFNWNENPTTHETEFDIVYMNTTATNNLPSIRLICDSVNRTDLKILSTDTDALVLYSSQVCLQHMEHESMSGGAIFCTILFVTAFVYFIGGALIMYFMRGARGAEVIPNFDFWVALPGLMKDGMIFILSGCRPFAVSTAETYDRI
ncbi:uncharacterized protein LOC126738442 isoform X2 [Anthonomus grandis grandis]|uniref:uncharacterized protein LOC126738442 isoform X2 n=1 Tax=Anthonomus grandis grandis TaxID=2921223 RepID=UPI002165B909|nr:uncharacterized protein LOC126738442 isoform X2 [Anthonomus grandis grandis]